MVEDASHTNFSVYSVLSVAQLSSHREHRGHRDEKIELTGAELVTLNSRAAESLVTSARPMKLGAVSLRLILIDRRQRRCRARVGFLQVIQNRVPSDN